MSVRVSSLGLGSFFKLPRQLALEVKSPAATKKKAFRLFFWLLYQNQALSVFGFRILFGFGAS